MFLSHWVSLPFILTPKGTSDKSRRDLTFGAMTKDVAPVFHRKGIFSTVVGSDASVIPTLIPSQTLGKHKSVNRLLYLS